MAGDRRGYNGVWLGHVDAFGQIAKLSGGNRVMAVEGDGGNGRVTQAVLATKLDNLSKQFSDFRTEYRHDFDKMAQLIEIECDKRERLEGRVGTNEKTLERKKVKIDQLEAKTKSWNVANSIGAIIASIGAGFAALK